MAQNSNQETNKTNDMPCPTRTLSDLTYLRSGDAFGQRGARGGESFSCARIAWASIGRGVGVRRLRGNPAVKRRLRRGKFLGEFYQASSLIRKVSWITTGPP